MLKSENYSVDLCWNRQEYKLHESFVFFFKLIQSYFNIFELKRKKEKENSIVYVVIWDGTKH